MVHITAVVETKTVVYSLTCDAFTKPASDNTKRNLVCGDLEAGHDCNAWKYPDAISLWKPEKYSGTDRRILYTIVSEKGEVIWRLTQMGNKFIAVLVLFTAALASSFPTFTFAAGFAGLAGASF